MKEVYPGIFLIQEKGSFGVIKPPENVYILAGSNGIVYDAGYGSKKAIKFFLKEVNKIKTYYIGQKKEFKLTRILVSHAHPDHFSGLKQIRDVLGLRIVLTIQTAEIIKDKRSFQESFKTDDYEDYLRVRKNGIRKLMNFFRNIGSRLFYRRMYGVSFLNDPDEIIQDKSEIIINGEIWKIFPSPGHSPEHISLYNEEKGIFFSGDNVLRSITTWLGPPESNINEYINSIKYIENLPNLKLILSAHGSPIEN
jgi:glyoxylase-like metal-dependent hydrolase (beta-lactamase superfamily II)